MQDVALLEQMQHFNRERLVHAKGSAAHGFLRALGGRGIERPHHDVDRQHDQNRALTTCRIGQRLGELRRIVGDDVFFSGLRSWVQDRIDGVGTTDEFVATMEAVGGADLDGWVADWLDADELPLALPAG